MKKIILLIFILLTIINTQSIACSLFNVTTEDTVIAGRNHDEGLIVKYFISFSPVSSTKNGTFFSIGKLGMINFPFEGLNDKGLFIGGAGVRRTKIIYDNSKIGIDALGIIRVILEKCSTVIEAVQEMEKYSIYFGPVHRPGHYMIADASGSSVVIEFVDEEMRIVKKNGKFQFMTNDYLTKVESNDNPPWAERSKKRLNILTEFFNNNDKIAFSEASSILKKVAQNNTKTSIVYDLKKRNITIVWQTEFGKKINLNLNEELKKGEQIIETSSLFGSKK